MHNLLKTAKTNRAIFFLLPRLTRKYFKEQKNIWNHQILPDEVNFFKSAETSLIFMKNDKICIKMLTGKNICILQNFTPNNFDIDTNFNQLTKEIAFLI